MPRGKTNSNARTKTKTNLRYTPLAAPTAASNAQLPDFLKASKDVSGATAHVQASPNSCWACAIRHIVNYTTSLRKTAPTFSSDDDVAKALNGLPAIPGPPGTPGPPATPALKWDIAKVASAVEALETLNISIEGETDAAPPLKEIRNEIRAGRPILVCIHQDPPPPPTTGVPPKNIPYPQNRSVKGGHWMVIVGFAQGEIFVFDPHTGTIKNHTYNRQKCRDPDYSGYYWQNVTYLKYT